ncbi:hypothetical protein JAAARDRAFT_335622 [Jaapia argillacea MUCL 33604]|uniref:Uncharacterized protein n=1 Tax=Jaapia argillacea MUCL 33604 TaxID=933084 RepID=A0A067PKF8_9AGAM|nr:hypothetical protein JAAARDRAFT_335622 [Jaapia argillacea MUCL 33604]
MDARAAKGIRSRGDAKCPNRVSPADMRAGPKMIEKSTKTGRWEDKDNRTVTVQNAEYQRTDSAKTGRQSCVHHGTDTGGGRGLQHASSCVFASMKLSIWPLERKISSGSENMIRSDEACDPVSGRSQLLVSLLGSCHAYRGEIWEEVFQDGSQQSLTVWDYHLLVQPTSSTSHPEVSWQVEGSISLRREAGL